MTRIAYVAGLTNNVNVKSIYDFIAINPGGFGSWLNELQKFSFWKLKNAWEQNGGNFNLLKSAINQALTQNNLISNIKGVPETEDERVAREKREEEKKKKREEDLKDAAKWYKEHKEDIKRVVKLLDLLFGHSIAKQGEQFISYFDLLENGYSKSNNSRSVFL